ncbi:sigma-E factor regulatory protein RseB domain-containing protein [Streptosporangium sp. NPDC051022]|uniref:sigma-E factor regulatory protein RseB domain-containing protein n=1 Tax=Streptosporangium sp. NPDC051022 TaxID=3155752 RepID=UPI0034238E9A
MIRLPASLILAVVMLLGLVAGSPAHAAPPDDAESEDPGLHLLREAAIASRTRGYAGTQYVTTWGRSGSFSSVTEVRNIPGQGLTVHAQPSGVTTKVDPGTPAGSMAAPSETMLEVLARNYRVVVAGVGQACGRPASLVHVLRADGTLAARYWLDRAAGLALRRELFDGRGQIVHVGAFVDLSLDPARKIAGGALAAGGLDLGETPRLLAQGWRFPAALPGRLELFAAHAATTGYLYLGYSDGLSVVSVFVEPGVLDEDRLRGWHAQRRDGHTIWMRNSAEQETIWASGGHVYTVFADAPADTVDAAVAALPHEPVPSLWSRLGRGAHRLLSWVNPFG